MTSDARNSQMAIFELKRPVSLRGWTTKGISMEKVGLIEVGGFPGEKPESM
jgi:hypothetical protein